MISVSEARELVQQHIKLLTPRLSALQEAAACILAADVVAPYDIPMWAQSAVDGYAFAFESLHNQSELPISQVVAAGDGATEIVGSGTAVRIFTGAALPPDVDTVVMQEQTTTSAGKVQVNDSSLSPGANVRPIGSEIGKGALALPAGTPLTPAALGYLAMLGVAEVLVYPKPLVALLVTGKELQAPGTEPVRGKVFEANSFTIIAALEQMGVKDVHLFKVDDSLEATTAVMSQALQNADLVLLTGGISVGDYDYVLPATVACGVRQVFHKVKQKPGKPLYFGMAGDKPVFGLPGNPASVLSCFYQYVVPAIGKLMQRSNLSRKVQLPLSAPVQKKPGLTHFLKGRVENGTITPLQAQESYRLSSFALANCLVEIPEEAAVLEAGSPVEAWLF
ncbi:molybdopterin molybdochelatase [Cnuella takakiae]|uniref:Molybdopterin molybdenumtransferase n=1 Tax=Cnuella takakiae TaxID=1302690 RepID=A0A1M4YHM2_9BACT|nr:gephyrin-like molybdotransferase Glp [Cnuella takakiae]OLY93150.1 hypothetical protein BUE76_15585 [Cnuella takakiae]SHF05143.1 molybdopterin molybdochelatase [Cnuella takakiae]